VRESLPLLAPLTLALSREGRGGAIYFPLGTTASARTTPGAISSWSDSTRTPLVLGGQVGCFIASARMWSRAAKSLYAQICTNL